MEELLLVDYLPNLVEDAELKELGDGWGDRYCPNLANFRERTVVGVLTQGYNLGQLEVAGDSESGDPLVKLDEDLTLDFTP